MVEGWWCVWVGEVCVGCEGAMQRGMHGVKRPRA